MIDLPFEIIFQIFIALSLVDRVQMMVGLYEWKARLNESLLYSINCDSGSLDFMLYNRYSENPFYRNQLRECTMTLLQRNSFNTGLLLLHPNLRIIKLTANYRLHALRDFTNNIDQAVAMPEVVHDFHHCELTRQIIHSNLGGRLHTIVLNFSHLNTMQTGNIMALLHNLPLLRHLVLNNPTFNIIFLERLHHNLPGLNSIELNNVHVSRGPTVTDVQPALNIARAKCSYSGGPTRMNFVYFEVFINYVFAKYDRLTFDGFDLSD